MPHTCKSRSITTKLVAANKVKKKWFLYTFFYYATFTFLHFLHSQYGWIRVFSHSKCILCVWNKMAQIETKHNYLDFFRDAEKWFSLLLLFWLCLFYYIFVYTYAGICVLDDPSEIIVSARDRKRQHDKRWEQWKKKFTYHWLEQLYIRLDRRYIIVLHIECRTSR